MMTADLLCRARAGDGEAFRELAGPHRRELQVHCYRMLGSFQDAEDALQETMLAAWRGIGGFSEERASLRTWLYKIATNRCLNARRAAGRRPARQWDASEFGPLAPTPREEAVWLQPFPDALVEGAVDVPPGPEARYEQAEAVSLAATALLAGVAIVFAIGECVHGVVLGPLVADLAPPHLLGRYMSMYALMATGGLALGPAIGGVVLATSPDAVWWGGALVAAVIGAGFLLSGDRIPEPLAVEAGVPDVGEGPRTATQATN